MQELLPRVESGTETENNAYVHGWTVVEQCICPRMDGSRTMQEQLSRSDCRGTEESLYFVMPAQAGIHLSGKYKLSGFIPI